MVRSSREATQLQIIFDLYLRSPVALNVAAAVARTGSTAVVALSAPKLLGVDDYGGYAYLWWVVSFAGCVGVLGYPNIVGRLPDIRTISVGRIMGVLMLAEVLLLGLIAMFHGIHLSVGWTAFCFYTALVYALNLLLLVIHRKRGDYGRILGSEVIAAAVRLLGPAAFFVFRRHGAEFLIGAESIAQTLQLAFLAIGLHRQAGEEAGGRQVMLSSAISLGALGLVDALLWQRAEVFFLSYSPHHLHEIALYNFTIRLATIFIFVPSAILDAMFPFLADKAKTRNEMDRMQTNYLLFYYCFSSLTFLVVAVAFRCYYAAYWSKLGLLLIAFRMAEGGGGFFSTAVYARFGEKFLWTGIGASGCIALTSNLLLTVHEGFKGAVASYIIGHSFLFLITLVIYFAKIRPAIVGKQSAAGCGLATS